MDRQVINYFPEWLREFREIKILANIQQKQSEKLWNKLESLRNNNCLDTLDENGCSRWEKMLSLNVKDTSTIEERRAQIKGRLAEQRPFTKIKLKEMLAAICGESGFKLEIKPSEYKVKIKVTVNNIDKQEAIDGLADRVLPANLIYIIEIIYNTYQQASALTFGQLSAYTFKQLREETIFKEG